MILFLSIIGLVDNGKTTLFRKLTNKKIPEKFSITQSLYVSTLNNNNNIICFDTPGHYCFSHIRENVSKICQLFIWPIALNRIRKEEFLELKNFIFSQNKMVVCLITQTDKMKEEEVLAKLESFELLPNYLGGKYEVFIMQYPEYKYNSFFSLKILTLSDLFVYLNEINSYMEFQLDKTTNNIFVLDTEKDLFFGLLHYCISLNNNKSKINSFIFEDKIQKILNIQKKNIEYIPHIGNLFYLKTNKVLPIGNILTISDFPIINTNNNIIKNIVKNFFEIFIITSSAEKKEALIKWCELNYIKCHIFIGDISNLQLQVFKEKKINGYMFFSKIRLPFFNTESFFELIDKILYDRNIFIKNDVNYYIFTKSLGKSKIIKVFNIDNNHIGGNLLLNGKVNIDNYACIFRNNKLLQISKIDSLKIKTQLIQEVKFNEEFGIIIKNLEFKVNDLIYFLSTDLPDIDDLHTKADIIRNI